MATVADRLKDSADRHTVYLLRWSRGTYRRHSKLIDEALADIASKLAMRAPGDDSFTAKRLQAMLEYTTERSDQLYKAMESAIDEDYRELAEYEAEFQLNSVQMAYPIKLKLNPTTPAKIHSAAMSRPFQGRVLRDWWKNQNYQTKQRMMSALRLGFVEDETISQVTSRVGTIGNMTRREVESIVRTATNHMAQVARNQVTEANAELFKHEEWSSTLDGRTSAICRGRDGKKYEIGKGPYPPAHFGCRSVRLPITKSWKELGFDELDDDERLNTRPFVADKRPLKNIPKDVRADVVGTTTDRSYNEWLKTQPREFVEDVLGQQKAKLYLDGDLPLDKFVDRQGTELTLEQLRAKESKVYNEAWSKAFG